MDLSLWSMFFHLIGFGLIMTMVATGWILHKQYTSSNDLKARLVVLSSARLFGLLSPFAILLMLITGIGNMQTRGLGLMTESWLSIKILLFVIAAVNGVIFGIRSKKRGALLGQIAQGGAPAGSESKLAAMDKSALLFSVVQTILVAGILILTVWKPGRYGA